jgi:TIGR03009 family protein
VSRFILVVAAAAVFAPAAGAQVPTAPVDDLLRSVEERRRGVETFAAACSRTDTHPLTKKTVTYTGTVAWARPNKARLDLADPEDAKKPDVEKSRFERFVCDGRTLWEYSPKDKLIVAHAVPKDGDDNVLFALLRGFKAADLKKRFDVQLTEGGPETKEWYGFVRLTPKTEADKQDFQFLELAIWRKDPPNQPGVAHLPCQVRYVRPNGAR